MHVPLPRRARPWAAALLLIAAAGPARAASNLDAALLKEAGPILTALQARGVKAVGVLKFRSQVGTVAPTYAQGPINGNLALALENALILFNKTGQPLILRQAGETVARQKQNLHVGNPADRERLFALDYRPAWGTQATARADGLLTGLVALAADYRTARVTVELLAPGQAAPARLHEFTVTTDRALLSDLALGFKIKGSAITMDMVEAKANLPGGGGADELIQLQVLYNDKPQVPQADFSNPKAPGFRIDEPAEGTAVKFVIRNVSQERVGVVLRVNGRNTLIGMNGEWEEAATEAGRCRRWVLDPNDSYTLDGFTDPGKREKVPFRVTSDEESRKLEQEEQHDKLGMIECLVFKVRKGEVATGPTPPAGGPTPPTNPTQPVSTGTPTIPLEPAMKVEGLGLLTKPQGDVPATAVDAQKALAKDLKDKYLAKNVGVGQGYIVHGGAGQQGGAVQEIQVQLDSLPAQEIVLRYKARTTPNP
jgi:hypothetical protein